MRCETVLPIDEAHGRSHFGHIHRRTEICAKEIPVQRAVSNQNQQFAVGRLGQSPTGAPVEQSFAVTTTGRLSEPAEFDNIIIRAASGDAAIVRLKDVGRAALAEHAVDNLRARFGDTVLVRGLGFEPADK